MAENDAPKTPKTPKTPTPTSHQEKEPFDADEVRETQLRRELEGVRNINEVIEGVIGTLERAKGNMGVSHSSPRRIRTAARGIPRKHHTVADTDRPGAERLPDRRQRIHPPQHLDPHPLADRTQPAAHPQPQLEGLDPGPAGHGGGGRGAPAGPGAQGSRGGAPPRGGPAQGRGAGQGPYGGHRLCCRPGVRRQGREGRARWHPGRHTEGRRELQHAGWFTDREGHRGVADDEGHERYKHGDRQRREVRARRPLCCRLLVMPFVTCIE